MKIKKKKKEKKIQGFSIRFMPYSEIKHLNSMERIKKILDIIFKNYIIILQGRLKIEEETRLIEDTMAMMGYIKNFKGIELAVISSDDKSSTIDKLKRKLITSLSGGDLSSITIIGPASVIKEMRRDPKKIELMLK